MLVLAPVVRRFFKVPQVTSEEFHANIRARLSELSGGTLADLEYRSRQLIARVHFAISEGGTPTRRGILFSFFQQGGGLAIGAALEDERYPIDDLIFDLSNLRAIIEHGLIEWRSLLRHLVWAPSYESTDSPALADLPPLTAAQQRR